MTSRPHQVTCAIGCCIVILLTLFVVLHKTHSHMLEIQEKLYEAETKFQSLSRHFDSMYEYKERLEKSFVNLKNEKSSMLETEQIEREDFNEVRSTLEQKIRLLEADLSACRKEENDVLNAGAVTEKLVQPNIEDAGMVPLLSPLSVAKQAYNNSGPNNFSRLNFATDKKLAGHRDSKKGDEKEAIQSPIAHVPGQPSGDPNEDTVGNVLI